MSNRTTPYVVLSPLDVGCPTDTFLLAFCRSLVAFGPKQRSIGEAAKTQETSNFRNTIGSLKRLIGRQLSDPEVQQIEKKFINATLVDVGGTIGAEVCVHVGW